MAHNKSQAVIVLVIISFMLSNLYSQNQTTADSLITIYQKGKYKDELKLLKEIAQAATNPEVIYHYANILINKAEQTSNNVYLLDGYMSKGNALQVIADYPAAIDSYFKATELSKKIGDQKNYAKLLISIADTFAMIGNTENATKYYTEGIEQLRLLGDSLSVGRALTNFGEEYFLSNDYEKALKLFEEGRLILQNSDYRTGLAYNIGNTGMVYAAQGKDPLAMEHLNEAIEILEELEDYYAISVYLTYVADIYANKNDFETAFKFADSSLKLATDYGLKDQISEANLKLSELSESIGKSDEALEYYKDYIQFRDSVTNIESVEEVANLNTAFAVSRKELEVKQQRHTKNIIIIGASISLLLIGLLAFGLFRRNKFIRKTNLIIERERNRSDHLLKNILPEDTALELKNNGKVEAKKYSNVSVLFTDFKNFTIHAEHLSPEDLVKSLDFYFSNFDKIIEKHGIEKIKTLGDSYMCAAGLNFKRDNHAKSLIAAALDLLKFCDEAMQNNPDHKTRFELRIGISSGPVVAGVVGTKKFAYDIWGDTVNIASRMESNGEAGNLNISEDTYKLIKDLFNCEYRGEIEVKNKGKMKMYFVKGFKDANIKQPMASNTLKG